MREDGDELPYCAAWGENDAEQFATLELAQAWCQAQIDRYIAKYAVLNSSLRFWSWDAESWKPKDRRRNLVRAAALLLAEIERLDRRDVASRHAAAAPWLT